jgi:hypothetical protein
LKFFVNVIRAFDGIDRSGVSDEVKSGLNQWVVNQMTDDIFKGLHLDKLEWEFDAISNLKKIENEHESILLKEPVHKFVKNNGVVFDMNGNISKVYKDKDNQIKELLNKALNSPVQNLYQETYEKNNNDPETDGLFDRNRNVSINNENTIVGDKKELVEQLVRNLVDTGKMKNKQKSKKAMKNSEYAKKKAPSRQQKANPINVAKKSTKN